jgi:hypothetical protein
MLLRVLLLGAIVLYEQNVDVFEGSALDFRYPIT